MGKKSRRRERRPKHFENNKNQDTTETNQRSNYESIVKENSLFDEFYKKQNIVSESEWDSFKKSLTEDLPATFRFTDSKEASELIKIIQQYVNESDNEGVLLPLSWYPSNLAWQLSYSRTSLRRNLPLKRLHRLLVTETQHGAVSRQEAVSMLSPLLLDVKPEHYVLDMCAAPGSKTAQIIEMLHRDGWDKIPKGMVIANDLSNSRCYMLVHQAKRLNSAAVVVTNHNAQFFPKVQTAEGTPLLFDRIMCDVPCSGDGTLRKNPDIWPKWTPANGLNLHGVQFGIVKRAVELLKDGGRLVYSTCSLNPLENESVVHRILCHFLNLRLVDVSERAPGLRYQSGLQTWLVATRNLEFYENFDQVDPKWRTTIRPQMFPPAEEDRSKYHLEKCMRIYPHHQDTGGFFVAVLEKIKLNSEDSLNIASSIKDEISTESSAIETDKKSEDNSLTGSENVSKTKQQRKNRHKGFKEDPFVFMSGEEEVFQSIQQFYNINEAFDSSCLLTRCLTGKKKNIYLCSETVRDFVRLNQDNVKIINTGVKMFVRTDNKRMGCAFRLAQEGLASVSSYIQSRVINLTKPDLLLLLSNTLPTEAPLITALSEQVQKEVIPLSPGSCILHYKGVDDELNFWISGWRGASSLRCYITDFNAAHFLRLLGGDCSRFELKDDCKIDEEQDEDDDNRQFKKFKKDVDLEQDNNEKDFTIEKENNESLSQTIESENEKN